METRWAQINTEAHVNLFKRYIIISFSNLITRYFDPLLRIHNYIHLKDYSIKLNIYKDIHTTIYVFPYTICHWSVPPTISVTIKKVLFIILTLKRRIHYHDAQTNLTVVYFTPLTLKKKTWKQDALNLFQKSCISNTINTY
jgi:hypothetical protein